MRLGVVVLLVLAAAAAMADSVDAVRLIDGLEKVYGKHVGFRRNHAKGVCFTGWFDGNGAAAALSRATVFGRGRVPVFGRFALNGGLPARADGPDTSRSMAVNFVLADGETWRTGMIDVPVFPVRDAAAFYDQLMAFRPDPATGKPDPEQQKAFVTAHPEWARTLALLKEAPLASGFANDTYFGLNAFRLVDGVGKARAVRWSMRPVDAFESASSWTPIDPNYLFNALASRLHEGAIQWHLVLTLAARGDPTDDATLAWPAERPSVDAGTLVVRALESEAPGNCRDVNFDPLVLPAGIEPSDDPLLRARSAAYAVSFSRRSGEQKTPSAVQTGK
ncbi:MAG TPA: catalase family peroxidase [Stellaceae bacterium]|nr:catalase family peroxidase [Stellaceae bacterium]